MNVILVHGMGRTPLSMMLLARRLRKSGFRTHFFGYFPFLESFASITDRLARKLITFAIHPYIGVGHSLGGLLLRAAVDQLFPPAQLPERLIMLGTPNHSPQLARFFGSWRAYRYFTGDSGQLLASPDRMDALPAAKVPVTLVAGTAGWRQWKSPFGQELNDAIVLVFEVRMEGATLVELPLRHTYMMNACCVADLVVRSVGNDASTRRNRD